jgi:hypothetical protein
LQRGRDGGDGQADTLEVDSMDHEEPKGDKVEMVADMVVDPNMR